MFKALTKFFKFSKSSLKVLKIQSMSYHNSGILIWPKWCKHINSWHSKNLLNMSGLVQCEFICFCKHVKTSDANWYDCTNMSWLVQILQHDLIRFYKHVQTSSNIMTRFDMILQTCPNLFMTLWYNLSENKFMTK